MIDINLLEYLLVFEREGSLLAASKVLNLSQPSLSKAMQRLEIELNLKIFDRKANKITLNENGKELLIYAKDIIKMNNLLLEKAHELKENEKIISIGYTAPGPTYKYKRLFDKEAKIKKELGNEQVLINGLLNNTYDIIFINKPINLNGFVCKKAFKEKLYISVPKAHFLSGLEKGVSWHDIDGQSFLLFSYVGYWENILNKNLKRSKLIKNDDISSVKELAQYSTIPSFLTNLTIKPNGIENRINIPILDDDAALEFYAVVKDSKKNLLNLLH